MLIAALLFVKSNAVVDAGTVLVFTNGLSVDVKEEAGTVLVLLNKKFEAGTVAEAERRAAGETCRCAR